MVPAINGKRIVIGFILCLLPLTVSNAADWELTPRLTIIETYSDNIGLDPSGAERSDLVTEISPGFSATLDGGRVDFAVDYTLQGLIYARNSEGNEINHQLTGLANAEVYEDHLFIDLESSIQQRSVTGDNATSRDNLALNDDRTNVVTLGFSPYWINDFAGHAESTVRYRYDSVLIGEGASDADRHAFEVDLVSGRRADQVTWSVNYNYEQLKRSNDNNNDNTVVGSNDDSTQESALARIDYALSDEWALAARAGYENDDLATRNRNRDDDNGDNDDDNGAFWSLGAVWTPSRRFEAEAFYGPDDNELTLRLTPSTRTSLSLSRLDRNVGVDAGVIYRGELAHRTRYSTWTARYTEETVSAQEVFLQDIIDSEIDDSGDDDGFIDPNDDTFRLTDEEFFRQRFEAGVAYERGRSQISISVFDERRDFDLSADESALGGIAQWTWQFGGRTGLQLRSEWEQSELDNGQEDELWTFSVAIARALSPDAGITFGYLHARQDSTEPSDEYRENRLALLLRMEF